MTKRKHRYWVIATLADGSNLETTKRDHEESARTDMAKLCDTKDVNAIRLRKEVKPRTHFRGTDGTAICGKANKGDISDDRDEADCGQCHRAIMRLDRQEGAGYSVRIKGKHGGVRLVTLKEIPPKLLMLAGVVHVREVCVDLTDFLFTVAKPQEVKYHLDRGAVILDLDG